MICSNGVLEWRQIPFRHTNSVKLLSPESSKSQNVHESEREKKFMNISVHANLASAIIVNISSDFNEKCS